VEDALMVLIFASRPPGFIKDSAERNELSFPKGTHLGRTYCEKAPQTYYWLRNGLKDYTKRASHSSERKAVVFGPGDAVISHNISR